MTRGAFSVFFALALSTWASPAAARGNDVRYDPWVDLPVTAGLGAAAIGIQVFLDDLAPHRCHWCAGGSFDDAARDWLRARDPEAAAIASDVLVAGALPLAAVGALALTARADDAWSEFPVDFAILGESVSATLAAVQIVKIVAARERPFHHALTDEESADLPYRADDYVSFPSGHTALAFSLVAGATTIAAIRGRRTAHWIAVVGAPLAVLVGTLRIVADEHWATDVLAGALVGTAMGFAIPWLFHRDPPAN